MPPPIANPFELPVANVTPAAGTVVKRAVGVGGDDPEVRPGEPPPPPQALSTTAINNIVK